MKTMVRKGVGYEQELPPNMKLQYYCADCYRWFNTLAHWKQHSRYLSKSKPDGSGYRCQKCRKVYKSKKWAMRHECRR